MRRWTGIQHIRIRHPRGESGIAEEPVAALFNDAVGRAGELLVVEADAAHWIAKSPLPSAPAAALQQLPNGVQQAVLSRPGDLAATDPADPGWALLAMPFIGRLQDIRRDREESAGIPVIDPALTMLRGAAADDPLCLALTNRHGGSGDLILDLSALDSDAGRSLARLDPLSLEESWLRLQSPARPAGGDGLGGVLESAADGPARLAGEAALRHAIQSLPDASADPARPTFEALALPQGESGGEREGANRMPALRLPLPAGDNIEIDLGENDQGVDAIPGWSFAADKKMKLEIRQTAATLQIKRLRTPSLSRASATLTISRRENLPPGKWRFKIEAGASEGTGNDFSFEIFAGRAIDFEEGSQFSGVFRTLSLTFVTAGSDPVALGVRIHGPADGSAWAIANLSLVEVIDERPAPPPGWHHIAAQIRALAPAGNGGARIHAAATALPAGDGRASLAVSPFFGVGFQAFSADSSDGINARPTLLASSELLCQDAAGALRAVASHVWESPGYAELGTAWAAEMHRQLSPESPIAIVRFRVIEGSAAEGVRVRYEFAAAPIMVPEPLARRVFRLRAGFAQLRFCEGQYGGAAMPAPLHGSFELAPPMIDGLQPLYLTERPAAVALGEAREWPWGLSGWRASAQLTPGRAGVIGSRAGSLWWQAPQLSMQYRPAAESAAAGLPATFRARRIKSLLPVLPDPPMPPTGGLAIDDETGSWQPVLPGGLRYLITGSRAGAMFALRHHLITQSLSTDPSASAAFVSGGIPAQHRMPRPVPLPANRIGKNGIALQTWAGHHDPLASLYVRHEPADSAFFAADDPGQDGSPIIAELLEPARGEIDHAWDGRLVFDRNLINEGALASMKVTIGDDEQSFPIEASEKNPVEFDAGDPFFAYLKSKPPGSRFAVTARFRHGDLEQALTLPLLLIDSARPPVPLKPHFIFFEDPEYNRALASTPAKAETQVAITHKEQPTELTPVRLFADRTDYNPDDPIAILLDWPAWPDGSDPVLSFERIDAAGNALPLTFGGEPGKNAARPEAGTSAFFPFAADGFGAGSAGRIRLNPGEVLAVKATFSPGGSSRVAEQKSLVLRLNIVAEPLTPAPDAAYALLRQRGAAVDCPRFAWGPLPARVDLVNPNDLKREVVRRRAVFRWLDVTREAEEPRYAIQKIAKNGATHFPERFESPERPVVA
ncbi:MAG: hypothetical protein R3F11_09790 [Verrucomicrobiales bacterium]